MSGEQTNSEPLEAFDEKPQTETQWTLSIGIHCGTLTSRESEQPKLLANLEECQKETTRAEKQYAKFGYSIWFADAIDPDGKVHRMRYTYTPYR